MLPSIKLTKSIAYLLICSLLVVGLIHSKTLHIQAAHQALPAQAAPQTGAVNEATRASIRQAYANLPSIFEENRGQVDGEFKYLSRSPASALYLSSTEAILASSRSVVRMRLQGANRSPRIAGESELEAKANYFIGNDPQQWHTDVPQYERVRYAEVYPGIDVVYYGQQQQSLEYDFEVEAGADPQQIVLGFKGVRTLKLEAATGDLLLRTAGGDLRQRKPVAYQEIDGARREVESRYIIRGQRKIGFRLGAYDRTQPLVIDPAISYSSYLNSYDDDFGFDIAVDAAGNAYVVGQVQYLSTAPDGFSNGDLAIRKINPNASGPVSLLYGAYIGGSLSDSAGAVKVDASDNIYVIGQTFSSDFPTRNQYRTFGGFSDAIIMKINTNLPGAASLLYSSYLGGSAQEGGDNIALGPSGIVYLSGFTQSANFPTRNPYQAVLRGTFDAFVAKFDTNLSGTASYLYGTYLGGTGQDFEDGFAVDSSGIAYLTGDTTSTDFPTRNAYQQSFQGLQRDAFVTKLDTNVSGTAALLYSNYLGGSNTDLGLDITADATGNVYVTGLTSSTNFPIRNQYQANLRGFEDVFVTKINTNLSGAASLLYSTYLGGNNDDIGAAIILSSPGIVYVTGETDSADFPTLNSLQPFRGGDDVFVMKLDTNASGAAALLYSTYLGGNADDPSTAITLDSSGNIYLTGYTRSTNFPLRNAYQATYLGGYDAFITKITFTQVNGDFDNDRKTELALWHPASGDWEYFFDDVLVTRHWGASGDRPVPGHYDPDGLTDLAVYRPSEGNWYIFQSFDQSFKLIHFGASTDLPVAADYDGDGRTDIALYRPADGSWYIQYSSTNSPAAFQWGSSEDKPVPADYDGDGRADLAVYRPTESTWYILRSSDNSSRVLQWGVSGDKPVVGDYDGDDRVDIALWRPSTRTWYALRSSDGSLFAVQWGVPGDLPVPGNYDGDRRTDVAVWRPSTGTWYIVKSSDGLIIEQQFGASGDVPVPAAYLPE